MTNKERKYRAYMLRLWQTEHDGKPVWRASVESPYTGERQGFPDLEALVAFLEETTGHSVDHRGHREIDGKESTQKKKPE